VAVLALHRLAHRLGTVERSRPQADHRGRPRGDRLQSEADGRERREAPGRVPRQPEAHDQRGGSGLLPGRDAPVLDKWEQKPFGDFVKRLRAAARA
jgi:hypothetical protein